MEVGFSAFMAVLEAANRGLLHARYNTNMLQFLCREMGKAACLLEGMPPDSPLDDMPILIGAAKKGSRLVAGHTRQFDLRTYYHVDYVHREVLELCSLMSECLSGLGLQPDGLEVMDDACVEEDRRYMHWYLTCILKGRVSGGSISETIRRELEEQILKQRERMRFVNLICEQDIELMEWIGSGSFGEVYKGRWNGQEVAVKQLKGDLSPEAQADFFSEVELHVELSHTNVVRCFGATVSNAIVMELAWIDLKHLCWWFAAKLTLPRQLELMRSACSGLRYLHNRNIVHGDVKTSNFLVFVSERTGVTVKIADFSLAAMKHETRTRSSVGPLRGGTELWMAPELCGELPHTFKSDVFAFGLVLFEIVALDDIYRGTKKGGYQVVLKAKREGQDPGFFPSACPDGLADLVRRCIDPAPLNRPTMDEVSVKLAEIHAQVQCADKRELSAEDVFWRSIESSGSSMEDRVPPQILPIEPCSSTWKCIKVLKGHSRQVTSLAVTNGWLASASADSTIRIVDLASWDLVQKLEWSHGWGVHSLAANNELLFASAPYQTIWVWKLGSWRCTDGLSMYTGEIKCLTLTGDWLFAASGARHINVWRLGRWQMELELHGHKGPVRALLANDEFLFSGSRDCTVRVWRMGGSWDCEHILVGHSGRVASLAVSGTYLFSGSWDRTIRVWSMGAWGLDTVLRGHTGGITSLAIKGGLLFSGSKDCSIRVWRVGSWHCMALREHGWPVLSLAVDGHRMFSCSADKTVRVWEEVD